MCWKRKKSKEKDRPNDSQEQSNKNTRSANKRLASDNIELTNNTKFSRCIKAHDVKDCH